MVISGWVETVGILCTAFMLKAVIFRYGLDGIWPINENIAANGSMLVDGNLVFGWKHWGNSWGKIPWQFPAAGRLENSQKNTNESMYIFLLKILVSMVGLGVSIEDVFPHEKNVYVFVLSWLWSPSAKFSYEGVGEGRAPNSIMMVRGLGIWGIHRPYR